MSETKTVRIGGLDPGTVRELREAFPDLERQATIEPEEGSVTDDKEVGTLVLILTLTTASLQFTTAVLGFLAQRQAARNKAADQGIAPSREEPR
jgi:hypothetical protein